MYTGHQYVVLRDEFLRKTVKTKQEIIVSLVLRSDPSNYTQLVLSEFDDVFAETGFDVTVIIGLGYAFKENLYKQIKSLQSRDNITVFEALTRLLN